MRKTTYRTLIVCSVLALLLSAGAPVAASTRAVTNSASSAVHIVQWGENLSWSSQEEALLRHPLQVVPRAPMSCALGTPSRV
jgi:hypothetical protein